MIVYKLTSPSGKSYIGITSRTLKQRLNDHRSEAKRKNIRKIHKALNKYPKEKWQTEILFETTNKEEACLKEIKYIKIYNTIKNGYNISYGGESGQLGLKRSLETCERISKAKKGIKLSFESIENIRKARIGKKQPQSQKDKVSKANSKSWVLINPEGKELNITNLRQFCKIEKISAGNLLTHGHTKKWKLL